MFININEKSSKPKYKQIVEAIIDKITDGTLEIGEKIPSINKLSEENYLSRDTVEKAYKILKGKKIIVSVKGKGFYISKTELISKINVFFLINKLSSYKMRLFNSFVKNMGLNAHVNLFIYHYDESLFTNLINKHIGGYDYYVVMTHFINEKKQYFQLNSNALKSLQKIPENKLILLDNQIPEIANNITIYQDFKMDIYNALNLAITKLSKYNKLILVYPSNSIYPYPKDIVLGFKKFCVEHFFNFEIIDEIYKDMELKKKECFLIIEEMDLVYLVKQARRKKLKLGADIGIISYNDTPLKDLLGITIMSTNFKKMGEIIAHKILKNEKGVLKNDFTFLDRKSL